MKKPEVIKPDMKKSKETHNFMSEALKFLENLNHFNSEKVSETDEQNFLENIDEFFSSFVYFREAYENKTSNIHLLSVLMEDIRTIAADGSDQYDDAEAVEDAQIALLNVMQHTTKKLEEMEDCLEQAEKDEQEFKRMETVERIFMDVKMNVLGAEEVFKTSGEDIKNHMTLIHAEMEQMEKSLKAFENNTQEFKDNCDQLKLNGNEWNQNFKDWKACSNESVEEAFNDLIEKIGESTKEAVENKNKSLDDINLRWEAVVESMEKKCGDTLFNVDELNEKSKKLLFGESVKQVFLNVGSAVGIINFFMLIALLVLK